MISVNHVLCLRWWLTNLWWEDTGTVSQTLLGINLRWTPKLLHFRTLWKLLCWSTRTILRSAVNLHIVIMKCDINTHLIVILLLLLNYFIKLYFFNYLLLLYFSVCLCRISAYQLWRRRILRPSCHKWKKCGPARPWAWIHSRIEEN